MSLFRLSFLFSKDIAVLLFCRSLLSAFAIDLFWSLFVYLNLPP
jgi:hypothetical protein